MILRSGKIPARPPKEPNTPRKKVDSINVLTPQCTSRGQRRVQLKSASVRNVTAWDEASTPCSKKHTLRQMPHFKDCIEDEDLPSPRRDRSVRVHFQLDDSTYEESGISSPSFCLYSPGISRSDDCSSPNPTEIHQNSICPYFSHLPEEEAEEDFNSYRFICSAQAATCSLPLRKNDIPCKTRSAPESTLVLDLEEVLVGSSLLPQPDAQFTYFAPFQDTYYKVYLKLRPYVREFLETLCKIYEIFVFTTAKREYAGKILEILDPQKKLIRHRLYQDHCVCVSGNYVKDLNALHRDLAKTVALDTKAYTLPFHLTNRIPVKPWLGNQTDKELLTLIPLLEKMTRMEDVRLVISHQFHVDELFASIKLHSK